MGFSVDDGADAVARRDLFPGQSAVLLLIGFRQ
jgi:hypothetical protein